MAESMQVAEYRSRVLDGLAPLPPRQLQLADCLGLITATSSTADVAVPAFTNSAMDGFAVHAVDVAGATPDRPVELKVIADVPAGVFSPLWVGDGQAVRIMTGAALNAGADAVVPVEATDQAPGASDLPEVVQIHASVREGENIRLVGEDIDEGDEVLAAGQLLTPAGLAAAAATGIGSLWVHPRPRVAIIATGAELQEPGCPLDRGQIHDSNSLMLQALVRAADADPVSVVRCGDEPAQLDAEITAALKIADLIITTGGVSVGTRDVVKNSSTASQLTFATVAMQPGKPQGFGHLTSPDGRTVPILALPGNPVSVYVSWRAFALPALSLLAGRDTEQVLATRRLAAGSSWRSPAGRSQYMPVVITEEGTVKPTNELGSKSHLIASLQLADGFAIIPAEITQVNEGDEFEVLPIGPRG